MSKATSTKRAPAVTPWFPQQIDPVHVGVYEINCDSKVMRFSHWNGQMWGYRESTVAQATIYANLKACGSIVRWRGLASKP